MVILWGFLRFNIDLKYNKMVIIDVWVYIFKKFVILEIVIVLYYFLVEFKFN